MRNKLKWIALVLVTILIRKYYRLNQIVIRYKDVVIGALGNLSNENQDSACPRDYVFISDVYGDEGDRSAGTRNESSEQLIPKVLYQTSRSRCMHPDIAEIMAQWRDPNILPGFSHFFYDDEAMDAFLFDKERWEDTFPSLHFGLQCIDKIHNPTMKADIWRYLVLWEYGGLYIDIDAGPTGFNASTIQPDDDGLFYLQDRGFIAQFFLIVSPRHPLMFYAVHAAIQNLLRYLGELSVSDPAKTTGPRAIVDSMRAFMNNRTAGRHMTDGIYAGKDGRSIRVDGHYKKQVMADVVDYTPKKKRIYRAMNMTHYHDLRVGQHKGTCYNMMNATETETGFEYEGEIVNLIPFPA